MNARSAARELALLTLLQLDRSEAAGVPRTTPNKLRELIAGAVRALSAEAEDLINAGAESLADVSRAILDQETDHPINLETPLDAPIQPVPLPNTRQTVEQIEKCLLAAEYLAEALRLPELLTLSRATEVQDYAIRLVQLVETHQSSLDETINRYSEDWRLTRLFKVDAALLRLAVAEMTHVRDIDPGVAINEAVELAKRFSTEDSYRFINGVLGRIAEELAVPASSPRPVA